MVLGLLFAELWYKLCVDTSSNYVEVPNNESYLFTVGQQNLNTTKTFNSGEHSLASLQPRADSTQRHCQ